MKATIFTLFFAIYFVFIGSTAKKINDNFSEITSANGINNDTSQCQTLWQGDCSYQLCEAKGWTAYPDTTPIANVSRILVRYIPNETITYSRPIGIYSYIRFKEIEGLTFNSLLNGEKKKALRNAEKIVEGGTIKLQENKNAVIIKYLIEKQSEYFAIAYIDEPEYIIIVQFYSYDLKDYNTNMLFFKEIVKSYKYLGISESKENIPPKIKK